MSADNYRQCPRCLSSAQERAAALLQEMNEAYGKIPLDEFDVLRREAETPIDPAEFWTLREDYEIGIWDGQFGAYYSASCSVCGFSYGFEHVEAVDWRSDS